MRIILILIIGLCIIFGIIKKRKAIVLVLAVIFVPFLILTVKSALINIWNPISVGNGIIAILLLIGIFTAIFRIRRKRRYRD
jgi:hypothetical protein